MARLAPLMRSRLIDRARGTLKRPGGCPGLGRFLENILAQADGPHPRMEHGRLRPVGLFADGSLKAASGIPLGSLLCVPGVEGVRLGPPVRFRAD